VLPGLSSSVPQAVNPMLTIIRAMKFFMVLSFGAEVVCGAFKELFGKIASISYS
jgi:hypothetical protein